MEDLIPRIKQHFDLKYLKICSNIDRYSSGIILCGTSKISAKAIEKSIRRAKAERKLLDKYLMLTAGPPRRDKVFDTVDLTFERVDHIKAIVGKINMEPVITRKIPGKLKIRKKEKEMHHIVNCFPAKQFTSKNSPACVVSLDTMFIMHNFNSVY